MKNIRSREYVLKELDRWYAARMKKSFTEVEEKKWREVLSRSIFSMDNLSGEEREEGLTRMYEVASTEGQVRIASSYFSQGYATMEALFDKKSTLSIEERHVKNDFARVYGTLSRFVGRVRREANRIFPDDLSDGDFNQAFISVFRGSDGFNSYSDKAIDASLLLLEHLMPQGREDPNYISMEKILKDGDLRDNMRELNKKLFSDLEGRVE
ncbi:MAG: hypothetical protein AABW73_04645 [Nanoarchaeota archaeon]